MLGLALFSTMLTPASGASSLRIKVALIKPEFTVTAYTQSDSSNNQYNFYTFYAAHRQDANVTGPDLNMLNLSVIHTDWGVSDFTRLFFGTSRAQQAGLIYGVNWFAVTDINVNDGQLFNSTGQRNYDVAIVGFSEYMTASEVQNFIRFVASGGIVIIMDGGSFSVEVRYYHATDHVALILGHGWQNYGTYAVQSPIFERFASWNQNWKGSNYEQTLYQWYAGASILNSTVIGVNLTKHDGQTAFNSVQFGEQDYLTNYTSTQIIAVWNKIAPISQPFHPVAAYIHQYGKGLVIHFGNYGSIHIMQDTSIQDFLIDSLYYANSYEGKTPPPVFTPALTPLAIFLISTILSLKSARNRRRVP